MTDRPILFSGPMVRAILDGRKTQTRRVLNPQPPTNEYGEPYNGRVCGPEWYEPAVYDKYGDMIPGKPIFGVYDEDGEWGRKVQYAPGDRLWVRETITQRPMENFLTGEPTNAIVAAYAADNEDVVEANGFNVCPWWSRQKSLPSTHMPRKVSRLTLTVTDVRVQRLQEISREDAKAEGMPVDHNGEYYAPPPPEVDNWQGYERASFFLLWNELNAKRGFGWDVNPWVVAVNFRPIMKNIDSLEEAA